MLNFTLCITAIVDNLPCFKSLQANEERQCNYHEGPTERIQEFIEALREKGVVSLSDNANDTLRLYECMYVFFFKYGFKF